MVFWQLPDSCLLRGSECVIWPVCAQYLCVRVRMCCSSHQLHEALAALRGDDAEVRLATAHHLRAGRRRGFGWDYFPHAITVWDSGDTGDREEAWGGPGTNVAISYRERGDKCVTGVCVCIYTKRMLEKLKENLLGTHSHTDIFQCLCPTRKNTVVEYLHSRKKVRLSLL